MQLKPFVENDNIENRIKTTRSNKGSTTYEISIDPKSKDHLARFKLVFQCSTYCVEQQYGPPANLQIVFDQWHDGKLVSSHAQDVVIASNIKNKINPKKKRKREADYSDNEEE